MEALRMSREDEIATMDFQERDKENLRVLHIPGRFVSVDLPSSSTSFHAVKKFLGPDGPFNLQSSRYTVVERKNLNSTRSETSVKRTHTQLVLGNGLHRVVFREATLWVHYPTAESPAQEHISVYTAVVKENGIAKPLEPALVIEPPSPEPAPENGEPSSPALSPAKPAPAPVADAPLRAHEVLNLFVVSANEYQHRTENDFVIVMSINEDTLKWDNEIVRPKRPIESVVLSKGIKEELMGDIEAFRQDKQYYRQHGIPYKRGYLLHGPPGCGKTSLITAIASHYDLSICPIPIANPKITDNVLVSLMTSAPPDSIIVIEDIDILVNPYAGGFSRLPTPSGGVTYSGLINALDGVTSTEDKIIILTTNYKDKLTETEALMRPGRIDRTAYISFADADALYELFLQYYPNKVKKANLFKNFIVGRHIPTAYLQNFFLKHKGDAKRAWDDCQSFVDDYSQKHDRELKENEERRRRQEEEKRKSEGGGSYFRLF